jgi:hypothetical protein
MRKRVELWVLFLGMTTSVRAAIPAPTGPATAELLAYQGAVGSGSGAPTISVVPLPVASKVVAQAAPPPADHVKAVLAAYSREILEQGSTTALSGRTARRLGFTPTAAEPWTSNDNMPLKFVGRRNDSTGEEKLFSVVTNRGKTEIILADTKNDTIRAYLVSVDGTLGQATYEATDSTVSDVTGDEAKARFEKELGFWIRYYDKTHPPK